MPDYFWTLDSAHHGISDNPHRLYATLHNVNLDLVSGPAYTNGIAGSLQFSGDPSSYAEITNTGGVLASNESFAWAMLLQADSLAGQGVILEYWDGSGGLRIQQSGTDILVEAQDTADNTYNFTVSDFFTDLQWKFFALTYINFPPTIPKSVEGNKFRYFYGTFDTDKPDYDKNDDIYVTEGTVLRGTGNVRLGASYNLSVPAFSGRMACLRYHSLYIMKFDRDASYPLTCDPGGVLQTSLETLSGGS
nr:hypothetical protein BaRGS_003306 [Batillaria attramentaria]